MSPLGNQFNLLAGYLKFKYENQTIDENKRIKNIHFQEKFISQYIENCFFRKSVLVWNQIESKNANLTNSSLTYNTLKFKLKNDFLSTFSEDPSMETFEKHRGNSLNCFHSLIKMLPNRHTHENS